MLQGGSGEILNIKICLRSFPIQEDFYEIWFQFCEIPLPTVWNSAMMFSADVSLDLGLLPFSPSFP